MHKNLKKIISFCFVLVFACSLVSCKNSGEEEQAVIRKEAADTKNFKPKAHAVKNSDSFESGGVSVSVTGLSYEDYVTKIKLRVKNDTDDVLRISTANLSVNGLMCPDSYFSSVEAKTERDAQIEISNSWLGKMDIREITELEFVVKAFDSLYNEILSSDILRVTTEAPFIYRQEYNADGFEIYKGENVRLLARSISKSAHSDDYELEFYVENNSDTAISLTAKDIFVNGKEIDALFVISVSPGKKCVDTMVFYKDDLDAQNIKSIDTVSASFQAFAADFQPVFETQRLNIPIQK